MIAAAAAATSTSSSACIEKHYLLKPSHKGVVQRFLHREEWRRHRLKYHLEMMDEERVRYKLQEDHLSWPDNQITCHAQLLAVTIRVIWLVGFSVEVVLPSLVQ